MNGFDPNILTQFGVAGLIFLAFMFLLKWVLKTQDRIIENQVKVLEAADRERIAWQLVISTLKDSIIQYNTNLTERAIEFREAGKVAREQHNKQLEQHQLQIDALDTLNKVLEQCRNNLEEQGKVLARINGKH